MKKLLILCTILFITACSTAKVESITSIQSPQTVSTPDRWSELASSFSKLFIQPSRITHADGNDSFVELVKNYPEIFHHKAITNADYSVELISPINDVVQAIKGGNGWTNLDRNFFATLNTDSAVHEDPLACSTRNTMFYNDDPQGCYLVISGGSYANHPKVLAFPYTGAHHWWWMSDTKLIIQSSNSNSGEADHWQSSYCFRGGNYDTFAVLDLSTAKFSPIELSISCSESLLDGHSRSYVFKAVEKYSGVVQGLELQMIDKKNPRKAYALDFDIAVYSLSAETSYSGIKQYLTTLTNLPELIQLKGYREMIPFTPFITDTFKSLQPSELISASGYPQTTFNFFFSLGDITYFYDSKKNVLTNTHESITDDSSEHKMIFDTLY
jgi:hypothetical protein